MTQQPIPKSEAMAKRKYVRRLPPEKDRRRHISERYAERNAAVLARRAQGATLERIGDEFGISGEMVRQILKKEERRRKDGKDSA
jgi:DNA-directed RNA polymerase sigma subunit (sigma70/sigma32)